MNPRLRLSLRTGRPAAAESDERLAELAGHGSAAAFDALIARHRRALVSECARVLGPSDAEEAVQEALIRAHARLTGGQLIHAPGPWLRVIARHTALNMLRARAARPATCESDLEQLATDEDAPERRRRLSELVDAVAALPDRQRHAIVMRELEGRSYQEIGARLGASDGAVRQLLSRARVSLRARLGTVAGLEPLVRVAFGGGAARVGAVSGAGVLSIKLGAALFFPAVAVTPHPTRPWAAAARPFAHPPAGRLAGAAAGVPVRGAVRAASAAATPVVLRRGSATTDSAVLVSDVGSQRPVGAPGPGRGQSAGPPAPGVSRHPALSRTPATPERTTSTRLGCDRAVAAGPPAGSGAVKALRSPADGGRTSSGAQPTSRTAITPDSASSLPQSSPRP